jgi:hypothetical protein
LQFLDYNPLRLTSAKRNASVAYQHEQRPMSPVIEYLDVRAGGKTHRGKAAGESPPAAQFMDDPMRTQREPVQGEQHAICRLTRICLHRTFSWPPSTNRITISAAGNRP